MQLASVLALVCMCIWITAGTKRSKAIPMVAQLLAMWSDKSAFCSLVSLLAAKLASVREYNVTWVSVELLLGLLVEL